MRLSAEPSSAREARTFVTRTLRSWGGEEITETAALLTSELVGNVVRHGRTDMLVAVRMRGDRVTVEVTDHSADLVERKPQSTQATSGRGLHLVDSLAERWGVEPHRPGKRVWFELPLASR
jgi:serine/threonine-protein kinase RsbW